LANAALGDPSASGTVAVSDVDSGEDKFQAPGALDGAYGTFTFDENSGAWTYTLNQGKADHLTDDELTSDTLNVTSFDGTASFAITVDITGSNDDASIGVVGTPDLTVVEAGGTANGTLGDPSASGQLAVSDVDLGENKFAAPGSLAGTYGIFTFNENSGVWTYTLDQDKANKLTGGEAATDKLTVTSFDNTASYDITVNIAGSNDDASISVVGSPDTNVAEAGGVGNGILGDPGASGQLAVSDVDFGENKFQTLGSLDGTYGKFTFDADSGAWNYLLDQSKADTLTDGELATDKLTVTSLDGTDTYDITVNIAGSNDDASISVVGSPDANVTEAGGVGNATPGDPSASGTLAVSDVDLGENKFQTPVSLDGIYGSFTFDADSGAWTYTLNQGKADSLIAGEAATDKLTVTSYDGTASFDIKVDITGSNDNASISVDDAGDSTVVEAGGTGNTTPGDPDALGSLAVGDVDAGQNKFKTPASLDGTYGTFTFDADSGDWTYTLDESKADSLAGGAAATDKLTVSSLDGTATYDITVDITGANDAPVARDDSYQTDEDVALIANGGGGNPAGLLGHLDGAETADDADVDGDDIDIAAVKVGATVVTDGGAGDEDAAADGTIIFKTANGLVTLDVETGAFSYMSNKDYNGSDGFEYKVADGTLTSDWAKVDLTINAVNDAPVIISNGGGDEASPSVPENTTIVTKVVATDVDGPTLKYTIGGGADAALFKIDEATGDLGFLAAPNFEAPGDGDADNVYDVVVKVSDGSLSDTQALHVAVTDVNEQPDAGADLAVTAAETVNDTTVLADVNATDPDFGGGNDLANSFEDLAYSIVAGNGAGLFEIDPATGQISLIAGKTLDYEATQQYVLTVRATDGGNLFDDVEVTIDVTDVAENHAPLATDDVWIISQSTTARLPSLAVLANDTDSDGHRLRVASVSGSGVTLNADGTITLVTGTTNGSFTYTVVDDHGGSDIGTVNFTVVNATSGFDLTGFAYDASYLDAAGGTDTLTGAGGIDVLYGGTGNNIDNLVGSTGNDILRGGQANDVIDGGDGIDLIDLSDGTAGITFTLTQSSSDASTGALGANLGTDTYKKIEGVIGTNSADKLTGSNSDDVIYGGGGNDTINGGDSNDVIYGGVGADAMNGGTGRDTYLYNGLSEGGATETISGFTTGATGDVLDLHDLLVDFAPGYDGTNAFTGGFVSFDTSLGNTEVKIDADGSAGGGGAVTLVTLTSVILTSVDTDNYAV
ncbi:MAG TPA: VCBS domain-containing protein, partial [Dongiaceae bacterium]|nr:VCBS domain-containing protein [Dongiaceae bacterium]